MFHGPDSEIGSFEEEENDKAREGKRARRRSSQETGKGAEDVFQACAACLDLFGALAASLARQDGASVSQQPRVKQIPSALARAKERTTRNRCVPLV